MEPTYPGTDETAAPWAQRGFPEGKDERAAHAVATYRRDHADRFVPGVCAVCELDADITDITLTDGDVFGLCVSCIENGLVLGQIARARGGWLPEPHQP